jgi:hypothetical protein
MSALIIRLPLEKRTRLINNRESLRVGVNEGQESRLNPSAGASERLNPRAMWYMMCISIHITLHI